MNSSPQSQKSPLMGSADNLSVLSSPSSQRSSRPIPIRSRQADEYSSLQYTSQHSTAQSMPVAPRSMPYNSLHLNQDLPKFQLPPPSPDVVERLPFVGVAASAPSSNNLLKKSVLHSLRIPVKNATESNTAQHQFSSSESLQYNNVSREASGLSLGESPVLRTISEHFNIDVADYKSYQNNTTQNDSTSTQRDTKQLESTQQDGAEFNTMKPISEEEVLQFDNTTQQYSDATEHNSDSEGLEFDQFQMEGDEKK